MADCLIGLGSNMGNRGATLDQAAELICDHSRIQRRALSRYHETLAVGGPANQQPFLNAALRVATDLSPWQMFARLRHAEAKLGRIRTERWGPRAIDLDLLLYDTLVIDNEALSLPHPRMAIRRFVLQPACEVAADMVHAPTGWSLARLLSRLNEPPCYVAVAAINPLMRTRLAVAAAAQVQAQVISAPKTPADSTRDPTIAPTPDDLPTVLEILSAQTDLVVPLNHVGTSERTFIADFWLNQFLAVARTWPRTAARKQLEQACHAALDTVPLPRFTLLLDPSTAGNPALHSPPHEALAQQLRQQATLPGQGPVLRVAADDFRSAMVELTAGIDAMR